MSLKKAATALAVAGALCAWTAQAHELDCEKEANGQAVYTIGSVDDFPVEIDWTMRVFNIHPSLPSTVLDLEDEFIEDYYAIILNTPWVWDPAPPFELAFPGGEETYEATTVIEDLEQCLDLAQLDGTDDRFIDNVFRVVWDSGFEECPARVVCPAPPPPPEECFQTRTIGYYSTHPAAVTACLGEGDLDFGDAFNVINTLAEGEGLLWSNPSQYACSGVQRTDLDRARYQLAVQLLGAICNVRLFGGSQATLDLIEDALAALDTADCDEIHRLQGLLDDYNNSGHECENEGDPTFPNNVAGAKAAAGFAQGCATNDPSIQTGETCE